MADQALADVTTGGKKWEDVAKSVSTDASAAGGGDLGWITEEAAEDPKWLEAVFAAEPNTPTGRHRGRGRFVISSASVTEIADATVDQAWMTKLTDGGLSEEAYRKAVERRGPPPGPRGQGDRGCNGERQAARRPGDRDPGDQPGAGRRRRQGSAHPVLPERRPGRGPDAARGRSGLVGGAARGRSRVREAQGGPHASSTRRLARRATRRRRSARPAPAASCRTSTAPAASSRGSRTRSSRRASRTARSSRPSRPSSAGTSSRS